MAEEHDPTRGTLRRLLLLWSRQHPLRLNALSLILAPSHCLWIWVLLLIMTLKCIKKTKKKTRTLNRAALSQIHTYNPKDMYTHVMHSPLGLSCFSCSYAPFMAYESVCKQQLIRQNQQQLCSSEPTLCCQLPVHYNSHTAQRSENFWNHSVNMGLSGIWRRTYKRTPSEQPTTTWQVIWWHAN